MLPKLDIPGARHALGDTDAPRVIDLTAIPVSIPLLSPLRFSTRALAAREYVLVRLRAEDGLSGVGYTYAGGAAAAATAAFVETSLRPALLGRSSRGAERSWSALYQETLLAGRRGMALRALSAVDMAFWDMFGKRVGQPLYVILGGLRDTVPAYASGGYYRSGDLIENVERELTRYAALGFTDFKIKVGGAAFEVDVERVRAARSVIGDRARLALDANNAWHFPHEALRFIRAVERYDPWWIEEPLSPDDIHGHAEIRRKSSVPVATGELSGERAPVWNPAARGLFIGLTSSTELRHLALAVLEGVAFSARHALGECVKAAGLPADELRLSGGGARSPLWNQLKASVHGRPLLALATLDSGVLGAALMGMVAAGIEGDIESAAERRVKVAAQIDPEPADIPRLDDLYGVYRETYDALVPVFTRLAGASDSAPVVASLTSRTYPATGGPVIR